MNTILIAKKRLAQGYTHVFLPYEGGNDFESCIKDKYYCAKSREEAIREICSERRVAESDFEMIDGSCFVWDIAEELDSLTSVCVRDREAGNIIDFFSTVGESKQAIREYETEDKYEGTYSPNFYEIAYRDKDGDYVKLGE